MEKKGEKPMGKIILVTGMLGNNSRGVPSFILNTVTLMPLWWPEAFR